MSSASERSEPRTRPKIGTIGVCALDAKARSKPSRAILNRLIANNEFDVKIFGDKIILDEEVENWPLCDFLISFFSDGFPLDKAIRYSKIRKPFYVNDLPMQAVLWDRRLCLKILDKLAVPTPHRIEVTRDGGPRLQSADIARSLFEHAGVRLEGPEDGTGGGDRSSQIVKLLENGDVLEVDGKRIRKPFVEKPVSGEDHNIHVYYQGGGGRRLFRKVNNKSSEHDDSLVTPRCITEPNNSYIYEQFLEVKDAEDVKAYTVGPDFCHAETRKSPVVDGIVKRNPSGKEIRYVTALTKEEQEMATKIAKGFGQQICGFDMLRVGEGKSYVIDVNGWSFVKDNNDYYDRCAKILRDMFIREKDRRWSRAQQKPAGQDVQDRASSAPRRETLSHRAAIKNILKSPSLKNLAGHAHIHRHEKTNDMGSPELGASTIPISSPNSFDNKHSSLPGSVTSQPDLRSRHIGVDTASVQAQPPSSTIDDHTTTPAPASKAQWQLKGVVSVVRHADRTPKQKLKFTFHTKPFVDLLKGHTEEVLLIGEAALASVLSAVREALREGVEDPMKLHSLQNALIKKGSWPGTKVQIKPMFRKPKKDEVPKDPDQGIDPATELARKASIIAEGEEPTSEHHRSDSSADVTLSRIAAAENNLVLDKLQLIIKWGGEPTHASLYQAQALGHFWRSELMLLNRDALNDVHVYSSSERRSTTTAGIFASTFLADEHLPKDFVIVRKDLLDDSNAAKDEMDKVKKKLKPLLREGIKAPPQFAWPDDQPEPNAVVKKVIALMRFHRDVMRENFKKLRSSSAVNSLAALGSASPGNPSRSTSYTSKPARKSTIAEESKPSDGIDATSTGPSTVPSTRGALAETQAVNNIQSRWCTGEDADLFRERWEKLYAEFCDDEKVDPGKISELYDSMKFDALHNRQFLEWVFTPDASTVDESALTDEPADTQSIDGRSLRSEPPSPGIPMTDKPTRKGTFGDRLGFRRKSESRETGSGLLSTANGPADAQRPHRYSHQENSYFSLYTGAGGKSRTRQDARLAKLRELYSCCKVLFDYIGPQEYGISNEEKLEIGLLTSLPLLKEIVRDLEEVQAGEGAKSFFYFTKESHIYTLLNCIMEGGVQTKVSRKQIPELDYLSQISFELYESINPGMGDKPESFNYSIKITLSPGCHTFEILDVQLDSKHCIGIAPKRGLTNHIEWTDILETLRAKFHT